MSGRIIPLPGERHRQIQALLPWYVAGTLDEADAAEVRSHLAACAECQVELAAERGLTGAVRALELEEPPAAEVEAGWRRFANTIAREEPPRRSAPSAKWRLRLGAGVGTAWLPWAVAGQACILLAAGVLLGRSLGPAPAYRALAADTPSPRGNAVVVFRPETPERVMREILNSGRARLVDGPNGADAYTIAMDPAGRDRTLARFRDRPEVVLAQPVDPGPSP